MAEKVTGWTFTKGNVGDKISDDAIVYSSTSCLRILRNGRNPVQTVEDITGLTEEESKEVIKKYKEEQEEYKKARDEFNLEYKRLYEEYNDADTEYKTARKAYETRASFNMNMGVTNDPEEQELFRKMTTAEMKWQAKEILVKNYVGEFNKKWGTSSTLTDAVTPKPPIIKEQEELEKELDELTTKLNKMDLSMSAASGVEAWFNAMDAYIDNMPQYKEDTSELYEVEQKGTNWCYTGNRAVPDPEFNKRIREFKQAQCKKLNALIEGATSKVEKKLNDIARKIAPFLPMKAALDIIKGGLSLDTLFKFGKAVFDFCTAQYQMVYNIYKNVMKMMELLVIRFPQLISKLMAKVVELDCPVQTRSISVKVDQSLVGSKYKKKGN